MKFNWGTNIAIVYIVFVLALVAVAVFSFTVDINLVTDNYYEKELTYQDDIDKIERTNALPQKPDITHEPGKLEVRFAPELTENEISGTIHLYRPSNYKLDIQVPLSLNNQMQIIPTTQLSPGLWKVKLEWSVGGVDFAMEKSLMIK